MHILLLFNKQNPQAVYEARLNIEIISLKALNCFTTKNKNHVKY